MGWSTTVTCSQCNKVVSVEAPGQLQPGWLLITMQSKQVGLPSTIPPPFRGPAPPAQMKIEQLPFCSIGCLNKWTIARLPRK